jgi:hypothetical protein
MTSQTNEATDERKALEKQARDAGVKGFLPKDDEVLKAKIADLVGEVEQKKEVKTVNEEVIAEVKPERKKAPRMNVAGIGRDDRTEMITKLERADPECKYVFQSSTITKDELAAKGLERTGYSVKNDIVCRTMKDSFEDYQQKKNEAQYEAMQRIDGGTGIVGNHNSNAKNPPTN